MLKYSLISQFCVLTTYKPAIVSLMYWRVKNSDAFKALICLFEQANMTTTESTNDVRLRTIPVWYPLIWDAETIICNPFIGWPLDIISTSPTSEFGMRQSICPTNLMMLVVQTLHTSTLMYQLYLLDSDEKTGKELEAFE